MCDISSSRFNFARARVSNVLVDVSAPVGAVSAFFSALPAMSDLRIASKRGSMRLCGLWRMPQGSGIDARPLVRHCVSGLFSFALSRASLCRLGLREVADRAAVAVPGASSLASTSRRIAKRAGPAAEEQHDASWECADDALDPEKPESGRSVEER